MNKALLIASAVLLGCMTFGPDRADAARVCTDVYAPVCAVTKEGLRRTFTNATCASAEGARLLHRDKCSWVACVPGHSVCAIDPATKRPTTYNSLCSAEFYLATVVSDGKCKGR
jgi:hypothetical protein